MDFSALAKLLYPFCGDGSKTSDFVVALVDNIMETPHNDADEMKSVEDTYNPLASKSPNTQKSIYNGNSSISKKDAGVILAHMEKARFAEYICEFSLDALNAICEELKKAGFPADTLQVGNACADIFEAALKSIVGIDKGGVDELATASNFDNKYQFKFSVSLKGVVESISLPTMNAIRNWYYDDVNGRGSSEIIDDIRKTFSIEKTDARIPDTELSLGKINDKIKQDIELSADEERCYAWYSSDLSRYHRQNRLKATALSLFLADKVGQVFIHAKTHADLKKNDYQTAQLFYRCR